MDADEQETYFGEPALQSDRAPDAEPLLEAVNPFGGIEALLTHCLSSLFNIPTAHSPMYDSVDIMNSRCRSLRAAQGSGSGFRVLPALRAEGPVTRARDCYRSWSLRSSRRHFECGHLPVL